MPWEDIYSPKAFFISISFRFFMWFAVPLS